MAAICHESRSWPMVKPNSGSNSVAAISTIPQALLRPPGSREKPTPTPNTPLRVVTGAPPYQDRYESKSNISNACFRRTPTFLDFCFRPGANYFRNAVILLLDNLVGPQQHRPRNSDTKRFCRVQVHDILEFCRLSNRQFSRTSSL